MIKAILTILEVIFFSATLYFAIRWANGTSWGYPALFGISSTCSVILDYFRRQQGKNKSKLSTPKNSSSKRKVSAPTLKANTSEVPPIFTHNSSSSFFSERFAQAFPGERSPKWFYGKMPLSV